MKKKKITIEATENFKRLDVFIHENIKELTRSEAQKLIKDGLVRVNGFCEKKPSKRVLKNSVVEVNIIEKEEDKRVIPQKIPLNIIYEDDFIIAVNKPSGMVVHPGAGNRDGTLVNALISLYPDIINAGGEGRPGIVHRLDKETSGVMIIARKKMALLELQKQFKDREVEKRYIAIVKGKVKKDKDIIKIPIGRSTNDRKKFSSRTKKAREAITEYKVLMRKGNFTLIEAKPKTGRTHQIRVHLKEMGHPIVGDKLYTRKPIATRLFLHARLLIITHPKTQKEMLFYAPPPREFYDFFRDMTE